MKYGVEYRKKITARSFDRLMRLYLECETWTAFERRVAAELPEIGPRDMRACRLHWLKKSYPWTYNWVWIGMMLALEIGGALAFSWMFPKPWFPPMWVVGWLTGFILWTFVGMIHDALHGEIMRGLDWFERGCPPARY